jgi:hypothetical protein
VVELIDTKENALPPTQSLNPPLNPPTRQTSTLPVPRPPRLHHIIHPPSTSIHPPLEGTTSHNSIFIQAISPINKTLLHRKIPSRPSRRRTPRAVRDTSLPNINANNLTREATKPPKTNSKSPQTAPPARPSTPPRTASPPATP